MKFRLDLRIPGHQVVSNHGSILSSNLSALSSILITQLKTNILTFASVKKKSIIVIKYKLSFGQFKINLQNKMSVRKPPDISSVYLI